MAKKIPDKWLYLPIVLLGLYFIIRIIDQSKLMSTFPLDFSNDLPAYMAYLFFLGKCGFHELCPYWYNGFVTFKTFFPGWVFFTYPIYKIFNNVLVSTYLSLILIYIVSFFFIFILGKNEKFSLTKRIAFFLFFFAHAINIGNFFKQGRIVSLFGFCMFLGIAMFVLFYRNNKIDKKFILFIPTYCFALLAHPQEAVLSSIFIVSLFIIKKNIYERAVIGLSIILSFIITSFWWIPFVLNLSGLNLLEMHQGTWLWATTGPYLLTSLAAFAISIIFFITFYYYWLSKNKSKKELLFFSPVIILNILFFFRLTPLIPLLRNISPDPYNVFFIFFIIYFFFSTNPAKFKKIKDLLPYALVGIVIISIGISHFKTPYFIEHNQVNKDTLEILEYVEDKYIFVNSYKDSYPYTYYSYAPIYLDLSTPDGFYYEIVSDDYFYRLRGISNHLSEEDGCETFSEEAKYFNISYLIAYESECDRLEKCGFDKVKNKDITCLYRL